MEGPIIASLLAQASEVEELQGSAATAWETFVEALPRVGIALGVLAAVVIIGRLLRPLVPGGWSGTARPASLGSSPS